MLSLSQALFSVQFLRIQGTYFALILRDRLPATPPYSNTVQQRYRCNYRTLLLDCFFLSHLLASEAFLIDQSL